MNSRLQELGTYLVVVGTLGILGAAASSLLAGGIVDQLDENLQTSSEVTVDAIEAAEQSVDVLASIVETIRGQSSTVEVALRNTADAVEGSRTAVGSVSDLASGEIPDTLEALADLLPALETAATAVDDTLGALDGLPIGPDYDPEVPLGEAVGQFGNELGDLAEAARTAGSAADSANQDLATAPGDLRALADTVAAFEEDLEDTEMLIDRYDQTLADARRTALGGLDTVGTSSTWAVVAVVVMSIVFALGQLGLVFIGLALRRGPATWESSSTASADAQTVDRTTE